MTLIIYKEFSFIKYSEFTSTNKIKIKPKINKKVNLYSHFINCNSKKFENIDEKGPSYLLLALTCI